MKRTGPRTEPFGTPQVIEDEGELCEEIPTVDVGAFQTAAGRLKTEDFRGDPRSGSSARGFIGFGDEGGVMIE